MCSTKLEKRTVKIVKSFLYRNTFDITLLDRYFEEKDVEMTLVFFLHSYICNTYWEDTFMFTDVFDNAFRKMVAKFFWYYPTLNTSHLKYTIDVSIENPVIFMNKTTQKLFNNWIKKEL